jgi:hypothetical protein
MALNSYAALQTSVADWLNRGDLVAAIPDFITLAEAGFNRDLRTLEMITRKTALSDKQYVALPTDWIEAKNLQVNGADGRPLRLRFVTMDEADGLRQNSLQLPTRYYGIVGRTIELLPTPSSDIEIEMAYYQRVPALATASTNWLLQKAPDLYLYGALLQAAPYLDNDERVQLWATAVDKTIQSLNTEASVSAYSGSPLVAKRRTFG